MTDTKDVLAAFSSVGTSIEKARTLLEDGRRFHAGRAYEILTKAQTELYAAHNKFLNGNGKEEPLAIATRTANALHNAGMALPITLTSLRIWLADKTEGDLLHLPYFGRKSLNELKNVLEAASIPWPTNPP